MIPYRALNLSLELIMPHITPLSPLQRQAHDLRIGITRQDVSGLLEEDVPCVSIGVGQYLRLWQAVRFLGIDDALRLAEDAPEVLCWKGYSYLLILVQGYGSVLSKPALTDAERREIKQLESDSMWYRLPLHDGRSPLFRQIHRVTRDGHELMEREAAGENPRSLWQLPPGHLRRMFELLMVFHVLAALRDDPNETCPVTPEELREGIADLIERPYERCSELLTGTCRTWRRQPAPPASS